jgi:hypothetical protein
MAANPNTEFCRLLLKAARKDAKQAGVEIPRIYCMKLGGDYIEVRGPVNGHDDIIWEGQADNRFDAKAQAINVLIERARVAKFVPLESVGSFIDPQTATIFPQNSDGTPDAHCGMEIADASHDSEWWQTLSEEDARTVATAVLVIAEENQGRI